jgi:hypothetical protein
VKKPEGAVFVHLPRCLRALASGVGKSREAVENM